MGVKMLVGTDLGGGKGRGFLGVEFISVTLHK